VAMAAKGAKLRSSFRSVPVRLLKDRLSDYLHEVEEGAVVVVTSHGRPVADLVPHAEHDPTLRIRPATRAWGSVAFERSGKGRTDSLALLLEERRSR
jgi:prevent-host-death family protein